MPSQNTVMERAIFEDFVESIHGNLALLKLNELAKTTTGLFLVILVRTGHRMVELYPTGGEAELPQFCQVFRRTAQGEKRCQTCRALVALGACYRGRIEYACHGGASVVAAPAMRPDGTTSEQVVVASCTFAHRSHAHGWPLAKRHAANLGINLKELKSAYYALPEITEENSTAAKIIVDAVASVLGEIENRVHHAHNGAAHATAGARMAVEEAEGFRAALAVIRDGAFKGEGESSGSSLVDLVRAMVSRDPSMPYSVEKIARATRVSPNHLSTLFSKHLGQTFQDFLGNQRILLARKLLGDPTFGIAEVAYRSGFADAAYFSRRFKQVTGSTPTEYRMSHPPPEIEVAGLTGSTNSTRVGRQGTRHTEGK
jgi:AraC-like DNA-binding protein